MDYYSAIKKNEILPFTTTRMNLQGIILSEIISQRKTNTYGCTYMWNLKNKTYEHKTESHQYEKKQVVSRGEGSS